MIKIWLRQIWSLDTKINWILRELVRLPDFLHAGTNSCKLKGDSIFLGWAWPKMGVASLVMRL